MISNGRHFTVVNMTGKKLNGIKKREHIIDLPDYCQRGFEKIVFCENVKGKPFEVDSFFNLFHLARARLLREKPYQFRFKVLIDGGLSFSILKPIEACFCGKNIEPMRLFYLDEIALSFAESIAWRLSEREVIARMYKMRFESAILS